MEGDRVTIYYVGHSTLSLVETKEGSIHYHFGGSEWVLPLDERIELNGRESFSLKVEDAIELIQTFVKTLVEKEMPVLHHDLERSYKEFMATDVQPIYGVDVVGPDPEGNFHLMINHNGLADSVQSYRFIKDLNRMLGEITFDNGCGARFTVERDEENDIYHSQMSLPELYFRPGGLLRSHQKWKGLEEFGPFTGARTEKNRYRILVLCPRPLQSSMAHYMGGLKHGLEGEHQGGEYPWPKGWDRYFNFGGWDYEFLVIASLEDEKAKAQLEVVLDQAKGKFDLSFLACRHGSGSGSAWGVKATLLSWNIPYEEVGLEPGISGLKRAYRIRETALRAYTKMGGRPWLLPPREMLGQEVVVGVGSSELTAGTYGFSVLFTRDGLFRMGKSSKYPSRGAWENDLGKLIVRQIQTLAVEDNWQARELVSLVFHLDDSLLWQDKDVIEAMLMAEFGGQYNLSIVFLRIGYRHEFRMWNLAGQGGWYGRPNYQVPPGVAFQLDDERFLVQMGSSKGQGKASTPLLIERAPDNGTVDLENLSWEVFRFSNLSYRDYDEGLLPVTLEYGNRLTTALDHFYQAGLGEKVSRALSQYTLTTWFL